MRYLLILTFYFFNLTGFGQARGNGVRRDLRMQEQQNQRSEQKLRKAEKPDGKNVMNRLERIKAFRTAFMSTSLGLNAEQSAKFLPLYNQYLDEILEAQRLKRENVRLGNGREQIEKDIMLGHKIADINDHYTHEFLKILPPEKVSQIAKYEQQFKDQMLKELKERKTVADN